MELTVVEFAKHVGVVPSRIRQLVLDGRIKARHLTPRMLLIDSAELKKIPKVRKRGRKPGVSPGNAKKKG